MRDFFFLTTQETNMDKELVKKVTELFVEFVGTFVLISVIIRHAGNKDVGLIKIAVVFVGCLIALSPYGNAHMNPALSLATMLNDKTNPLRIMAVMASQVAGAVVAVQLMNVVK